MNHVGSVEFARAGTRGNVRMAPRTESAVRVAVAEIGSRAVRLLIADVSRAEGLVPRLTDSVQVDLMASIRRGDANGAVASVARVIAGFRQQALEFQVQGISMFGTEAMRVMTKSASAVPQSVMKDVEILNRESEALCSLIAAVKGLPDDSPSNAGVLVIDQGGGSIEIATGRAVPSVEMFEYISLNLGTDRLLQQFKLGGESITKLLRWIKPQVDEQKLGLNGTPRVIVQGSVATKCAWLAIRKSEQERYKPALVHGQTLSCQVLQQSIMEIAKLPPELWGPWKASVDPRNPNSDEFARTLTGCIALFLLLARLKVKEVTVSAYGTRYGKAWQLAGLAPRTAPKSRRSADG